METAMLIATIVIGVAEILLTIWLFVISAKTGRIDKLEDGITAKAEALIAAKFDVAASELREAIAPLGTAVEGINRRLEKGDAAFKDLDDVQRSLEIGAEKREGQLRLWIQQTFGTKAEVEGMARDLAKVERELSAFSERCKAHLNAKR